MFAVHVRRPPADLTRRQAGLLLDGGVTRWSQLGLPGGRLTVTRKPAALRRSRRPTRSRSCPASKVGPGVRVLSVDGHRPAARPRRLPDPGGRSRARPGHHADRRRRHHARPPGRRAGRGARATRRTRSGRCSAASAPPTSPSATSRARCRRTAPPTQGGDSFAADPRVRAGPAGGGLRRARPGQQPRRRLRRRVRWCRPSTGWPTPACARSAPAATWPTPAGRRWSTRHGVRFGFVGFNAIGETPEAGPGPAGRELGQHAAAHRAARPGRARPGARRRAPARPPRATW